MDFSIGEPNTMKTDQNTPGDPRDKYSNQHSIEQSVATSYEKAYTDAYDSEKN